MPNNKELFDIVTDLRRCVLCLSTNNVSSAQTFLNHANMLICQIKEPKAVSEKMQLDLKAYWDKLYTTDLQSVRISKERRAEQILTLSSLVFLRTLYA